MPGVNLAAVLLPAHAKIDAGNAVDFVNMVLISS
jgi:hypothetical protein